MRRVVTSTDHQLLKYPTPVGMTDIRGGRAMARIIAAVAQKKFGWMAKSSRAVSDKKSLIDKRQRVLTNNNYRTKEMTSNSLPSRRIQTPTHPLSRETQTAKPRRNRIISSKSTLSRASPLNWLKAASSGEDLIQKVLVGQFGCIRMGSH